MRNPIQEENASKKATPARNKTNPAVRKKTKAPEKQKGGTLPNYEEVQKSLSEFNSFLESIKSANKTWYEVGREVFYRKSILISAEKVLRNAGIDKSVEIAATDVFVEKAQKKLSIRALILLIIGIILALTALGFAIYMIFFLKTISLPETNQISTFVFTLLLLKTLSIGGLIFSIIYFLASISKALFHESLSLYNKRHSLRFGRLYIYLNKNNINFEDMEEAFNWNKDYPTAFKDIDTSVIKTPASKIIDIIPDLINRGIDEIKEVKPPKAKKTLGTLLKK